MKKPSKENNEKNIVFQIFEELFLDEENEKAPLDDQSLECLNINLDEILQELYEFSHQ